jgi:phosphoenolpyruvate synthase/pyruvate phosphate dikinase
MAQLPEIPANKRLPQGKLNAKVEAASPKEEINAIRNGSVTTDSTTSVRLAIDKPTATPAKPTDEINKTWAEFFKMVVMDALTATEAQKKDNIDIRTEQIEQGLQTAEEQGLGKWTVKVAGRSFMRVSD